jgi:hypothetical protein
MQWENDAMGVGRSGLAGLCAVYAQRANPRAYRQFYARVYARGSHHGNHLVPWL